MRRTVLTRRAGAPGTKKLVAHYGENLVCVRYRYDDELHERIKTVEIVVDRVKWYRARDRAKDSSEVFFRLMPAEDLLRRAVLFAGGRWHEANDVWSLPRASAAALGLTSRALLRPGFRSRDRR